MIDDAIPSFLRSWPGFEVEAQRLVAMIEVDLASRGKVSVLPPLQPLSEMGLAPEAGHPLQRHAAQAVRLERLQIRLDAGNESNRYQRGWNSDGS